MRGTGYATSAAHYCAIRGAAYKMTASKAAAKSEQGSCVLPGGRICDVHALYAGKC